MRRTTPEFKSICIAHSVAFTQAELRDIFSLNLKTDGCQTRQYMALGILRRRADDLLGCDCDGDGRKGLLTPDPSNPPSPEKQADGDSSEDEALGFRMASQYDDVPVCANPLLSYPILIA